jgi:hypothetical protein
MAAARPVVLTSHAAKGVRAVPKCHYRVANDVAEFAGAVVELLQNDTMRAAMGKAAREFVAGNFRWESELERFEAIVDGNAFKLPPLDPSENRPVSKPAKALPLFRPQTTIQSAKSSDVHA